ncbi:MAG: hypothetical protein ACW99X_17970, partial [Candidatus Thorarchaeota archaeon]
MISQLLEIAPDIAGIIALLLPIVIGCIFFLIIPVMRDGSGSALRRYVSYLIKPPRLGSTEDGTQSRTSLGRDIKVKLFFVYLGIALFLISFTMSEFYEVIFDLIMPVTQGSTGEIRTVTSIVFLSPFTAGWVGALPWYGYLPAPAGLGTYHDPWGWIFATSAYTDNPNFLGTMVTVLVMFSFIVGILFLIPLAFKRIRQSILPSLFFFTSGMMIFTKAAIGGLGHALALTFGAQLRVGIMIITGTMIPDLNEVIAIGFLIVFALYIFFAF